MFLLSLKPAAWQRLLSAKPAVEQFLLSLKPAVIQLLPSFLLFFILVYLFPSGLICVHCFLMCFYLFVCLFCVHLCSSHQHFAPETLMHRTWPFRGSKHQHAQLTGSFQELIQEESWATQPQMMRSDLLGSNATGLADWYARRQFYN